MEKCRFSIFFVKTSNFRTFVKYTNFSIFVKFPSFVFSVKIRIFNFYQQNPNFQYFFFSVKIVEMFEFSRKKSSFFSKTRKLDLKTFEFQHFSTRKFKTSDVLTNIARLWVRIPICNFCPN